MPCFEYIQLPRGLKMISNSLPLLNCLFKDIRQLSLCTTFTAQASCYNNSVPIPHIKVVPEPLWCAELECFSGTSWPARSSCAQNQLTNFLKHCLDDYTFTYIRTCLFIPYCGKKKKVAKYSNIILCTPYISRVFYFREFRESGAIREFINTRKYLPPIPTHECDLCTQYIALLDHEFNHSRKCL